MFGLPAGKPAGLIICGAFGSGLKVIDPFSGLPLMGVPQIALISRAFTVTPAVEFCDMMNTDREMLENGGMVASKSTALTGPRGGPCSQLGVVVGSGVVLLALNAARPLGSRDPLASAGWFATERRMFLDTPVLLRTNIVKARSSSC